MSAAVGVSATGANATEIDAFARFASWLASRYVEDLIDGKQGPDPMDLFHALKRMHAWKQQLMPLFELDTEVGYRAAYNIVFGQQVAS